MQTHSNAIMLGKSGTYQSWRTSVSEDTFIAASATKKCLKSVWQIRHVDHDQSGTGAGQLAADEVKMEPKIEFSIQGISHAEVQPDEEKKLDTIH